MRHLTISQGPFGLSAPQSRLKIIAITLLLAAQLLTIASSASPSTQLYLPVALRASAPTATARPSWGAPVAVSPADGSIWIVNPDAGSVTQVNATSLAKEAEIATGGEPWSLAFSPGGDHLYIVDRARGLLLFLDTQSRRVDKTIPIGPEPGSIALSPSGKSAYLTITAANTVAVVDTAAQTVTTRIAVAPLPFALAVSNDGDLDDDDEQLYLTHLHAFPRPGIPQSKVETTDDGRAGRLTLIAAKSLTITKEIDLLPDSHGFPNLLSAIAIWGKWAWVPQVQAAPALPNGLTTTIFAAVSTIDRLKGAEEPRARLSLNDQEIFASPVNNPVAAIPSPDGKRLYVVLAGSNLVEIIDIGDPYQPRLVKFLPAGQNPRGIALSADGHFGYVMSYLSRSLTVLDLVAERWLSEVPVTGETLDPALLRGKILFNSATDPRLARASWFSCASCHLDGGSDGVTWFFPDGPRQSPALWNSGKTLPWHWSAALDEAQDVEVTIQLIQQGIGLAPGIDPPLLGKALKGHSSDLDALALFLSQGMRAPRRLGESNAENNTESNAQEIAAGRRLFISAGCASCHGGVEWTISAESGPPGTLDPDGNGMVDALLRDVATLAPADLRGATGFDVPSLLGVGLTAPYLHDGSLPTLDALLRSGHPQPSSLGAPFSNTEIQALVAFLRSIGADTPPILDDRS